MRILITALVTASCLTAAAAEEPLRVTVDNFRRAESDSYFGRFVKDGGFGKFHHERELADIDHQTVIRLNRDTLYSFGVFLIHFPVQVAIFSALPEQYARHNTWASAPLVIGLSFFTARWARSRIG